MCSHSDWQCWPPININVAPVAIKPHEDEDDDNEDKDEDDNAPGLHPLPLYVSFYFDMSFC
jgi:hypothetical protein